MYTSLIHSTQGKSFWFIYSNTPPTFVVQPESTTIYVFRFVVIIIIRWITTTSSPIIPTTTLPVCTTTSTWSARTSNISRSLLAVVSSIIVTITSTISTICLAPPLPAMSPRPRPLVLSFPLCHGRPRPGFSLTQILAREDVGSSNSSSLSKGDEV